MLSVVNLRVTSLSLDYLDVSWEIESTREDVWDYRFTVERSQSPQGPFDQVSQEFTDRYLFRDIGVPRWDLYAELYYRIKVRRVSDDETAYSEPVRREARPDLIAMEVRRLEHILFREHIGRRCFLFPRRTFGQRCPSCYDPVTGGQLKSNCKTCYDTSYVRGYLDPIEMRMQIDPTPKHVELMEIQKTQQENATARCVAEFPIKPMDMLVEFENRRWRVQRVSMTQRLRYPLHYELVLHHIPRRDIEWQLPINLEDLPTYEPSPEREFTNPHSLETHTEVTEGYLQDGAVYGYRRGDS
jgi:hypothetical protein